MRFVSLLEGGKLGFGGGGVFFRQAPDVFLSSEEGPFHRGLERAGQVLACPSLARLAPRALAGAVGFKQNEGSGVDFGYIFILPVTQSEGKNKVYILYTCFGLVEENTFLRTWFILGVKMTHLGVGVKKKDTVPVSGFHDLRECLVLGSSILKGWIEGNQGTLERWILHFWGSREFSQAGVWPFCEDLALLVILKEGHHRETHFFLSGVPHKRTTHFFLGGEFPQKKTRSWPGLSRFPVSRPFCGPVGTRWVEHGIGDPSTAPGSIATAAEAATGRTKRILDVAEKSLLFFWVGGCWLGKVLWLQRLHVYVHSV